MNKIEIETAQNISISFEPATLGQRWAGLFYDYIILVGVGFLLLILSSPRLEMMPEYFMLIYALLFSLYDLVCEILMNGQSIGKKLAKTRVVKLDGSNPDFSSYAIRWIFQILDCSFTMWTGGLLAIWFGGKGQRIGDIAAGTCVISLRETKKKTDLLEEIQFTENYRVEFAQVEELNDSDIRLIREALEEGPKMEPEINEKILQRLKTVIEKKMGNAPSSMAPEAFLQQVISDYTFSNWHKTEV